MNKPEIRIYFSWLLYDNVSKDMFDKYSEEPQTLLPKERCFEFAQNYQKEWAKYESKIIPALTEALGVDFYRKTIDVACAPWLTAQSEPLLMSFYYEPDQFIDVLTHELCHILLTDNSVYSDHSSKEWINLVERWESLFGKQESSNTAAHIPVHALCKYIAVDVLGEPSRVDRDIEDVKHNKPYVDSWEYVNTHNYKEIISQLKEDYAKLAN